MALDLSSVEEKLGRSKEHFDEVHRRASERLKPEDYKVSMQLNPDATEHVWKFHALKGTHFPEISLSAGDCIHNLRCALDHLVYAIGVHESGEDPPPKANTLAFPLACNASQFNDAKRRIATLSGPVRTAIQGVQPYNRPNKELPPLLGLLGEFDDIDKHRLLQLAVGEFAAASFGWKNVPAGAHNFAIRKPGPNGLEDGAILAVMLLNPPQPDMKGEFDGSFILIMPHQPGPNKSRGTEVRTILNDLRDEVKAVIDIVVAAV